jgi:Kelch motif
MTFTTFTFALVVFFKVAFLVTTATCNLEFNVLDTILPKALSDHSALVHNPHGTIYLVGGCDDPEGNTYVVNGIFVCNSISASAYKFDTVTQQFVLLSDMPCTCYHHTSAILNNQLWIIGGQTVPDDALIPEIDVR